jgi:hypothetical protein
MAVKQSLYTSTLAAAGIVLAAWMGWPERGAFPQDARPPRHPKATAASDEYQGVASCSTAGCHNGNGPRGTPGSEYSTWMLHDPHAQAYAVLWDDKSRQIARHLQSARPAHQDPLCLNCHVHPQYESAAHHERFSPWDGVGCESCHGPAQRWLREHSRPNLWRGLTTEEKKQRGMNDTLTAEGRAQTCVACHVGEGESDVTHDLIAAGHPRLNFEFSSYHAILPRHWDERRQVSTHSDWEVVLWQEGQKATAGAALRLLGARARRSRPWPELAEFDCFACHHHLQSPSPRQRKQPGRRPGVPPWSGWYTAMVPEALPDGPAWPALQQLRRHMERFPPDPSAVAASARAAGDAIAKTVTRRLDAPLAEERMRRLLAVPVSSWDEETQVYLGLLGHYHAGDAALKARWKGRLRDLANQLDAGPSRRDHR